MTARPPALTGPQLPGHAREGSWARIREPGSGWLVAAAAVAAVGMLGTGRLLWVGVGGVTAGLFLAAVRHPGWALAVLVVALGVRIPLAGVLLRQGVPADAVRATSYVEELLVAAVIVAAIPHLRRRPGLDRIERVAVAFVGAASAYLLLTVVVRRLGTGWFPLAPESLSAQLFAYRGYVAGIVLALAVRRLPLDRRARRRILAAVLALGGLLAAGALLQQLRPQLWADLMDRYVGVPELHRALYDIERPTIVRTRVFGREVVRAGSLLFDYLQAGFVMLPALAIALVRLGRRGSAWWWAVTAVLGLGVVATMSRAAMLGAAAVVGVLLLRRVDGLRRERLVAWAALGGAATLVVLSPGDLLARLGSVLDPGDPVTRLHLDSLARGLEAVGTGPLGHGIGLDISSGLGDGPAITSENAYLQLGVEMGVAVLAVFLAVLAVVWRRLWTLGPADPVALAALATVAGFAVGAMFLHVWTMLTAAWVGWLLVALALPAPDRSPRNLRAPPSGPAT